MIAAISPPDSRDRLADAVWPRLAAWLTSTVFAPGRSHARDHLAGAVASRLRELVAAGGASASVTIGVATRM